MRHTVRAVLLLVPTLAGSCLAPPSPPPSQRGQVTPQRPTLSSDTNTTAPGTVEIEAGVTVDPGDVFGTPLSLKFGVGETTEVFLGWTPVLVIDLPGDDASGPSDVVLGTRHRFVEETESRPSFAWQGSIKLPTADVDEGLGTGEVDVSLAGIATKSLGALGATAFYSLDLLGSPDESGMDVGHSGALALGAPLNDTLGAFGELAGIFLPEDDAEIVFTTLGLALQVAPWLVVDAAAVVGLSDEAPDLQAVLGLTHNLGPAGGRRRALPMLRAR